MSTFREKVVLEADKLTCLIQQQTSLGDYELAELLHDQLDRIGAALHAMAPASMTLHDCAIPSHFVFTETLKVDVSLGSEKGCQVKLDLPEHVPTVPIAVLTCELSHRIKSNCLAVQQ